jgi:hypothetical protein
MGDDPARDALLALVDILKPLPSPDRKRAVLGALHFLEEDWVPLPRKKEEARLPEAPPEPNGAFPAAVQSWMKKNDLTAEEVEQVFALEDGKINIIADLPGRGKRDKTITTYTLMGLGTYLHSGDRKFADEPARETCAQHDAYDGANHAATMREMKSELTGDKSNGWTITWPGLKKGAAIVKEIAAGSK